MGRMGRKGVLRKGVGILSIARGHSAQIKTRRQVVISALVTEMVSK